MKLLAWVLTLKFTFFIYKSKMSTTVHQNLHLLDPILLLKTQKDLGVNFLHVNFFFLNYNLENIMLSREAWWAIVHGVTMNQTWQQLLLHFFSLTIHTSTLKTITYYKSILTYLKHFGIASRLHNFNYFVPSLNVCLSPLPISFLSTCQIPAQ